jgi:uncharacterized protein
VTDVDGRWISVVAVGEASVAPDMATVSFAVSATGKDLGATRGEVNERATSVLDRLRAVGIADADLNAPDVAIHPEYDYRKAPRLTGYRVARAMTARVRALDTLGEVLDALSTAGANEVHGAHIGNADPSAAEHVALRAAVLSARARAEVIAEAGGVRLGSIERVEEEPTHDGSSPHPRMVALEAADTSTEVVTGDVTVRRQVRVWFAIDA